MIQLLGMPFQQSDMWPSGSIENIIIQKMQEHPIVYSYQSLHELSFELQLRKNIIASARALSESDVQFETFADSYCNSEYWNLTLIGGFQQRQDVLPSHAIRDIYHNSSLYGFECATAKVIIYYHAVLNTIGEPLFNRLFQNLYLYSWHFDPDLGLHTSYTTHFLPGDVVYFNNPDVSPKNPWWRGENAVVLEDGKYYGHGLGIKNAEQVIEELNKTRKRGSDRSAYLTNLVARPSFIHLARLFLLQPRLSPYKIPHVVVHHNESSISCQQYISYLNRIYNQSAYASPVQRTTMI